MIPMLMAVILASSSPAPAPAKAPEPARAEAAQDSRRRVPRPVRPDTARVTLGSGRTASEAFVAFPPGDAPAPGIVIVHEWWGLNAQIREVARRLAKQGYVAIVPDLYHGKLATDPETAHILMRGLDDAEAIGTLQAAGAWLSAEGRTMKRKRAVLGFCMGGGLALREALDDPGLAAVVMFYGSPESRAERLASLRAPLLGHFGAEDQGIDVERVKAFETTLHGARKEAEIDVYEGAGHAFMNEEQASYRPDAARLAWARTLDFLQKHLKAR